MKKLIALLIILLAVSLALIYLFIPAHLTVSDFEKVQCSLPGANRVLSQPENWKKFWHNNPNLPAASVSGSEPDFIFNKDTFRIIKVLQNGLLIDVSNNEIKTGSALSLLPLSQDSLVINWTFEIPASLNPVKRIQQYNGAAHLKNSMEAILKNIKDYLNKNEKIYGFPLIESSITDTFLISTKSEFPNEPSVPQVYKMIDKLMAYATANHANPTNAPMMNVTKTDKNSYTIMVALPLDKTLAGNSDISYKRMVPGRFLTTTVTGGNQTIEHAQKEMQQYFQDYSRVAMAIPFMYLVTDRSKEADSSKWVTKLYFPVM